MKQYYFSVWGNGGFPITGTGVTDGGIPAGAVECTETQYKNPGSYSIDTSNMTVVSAPVAAQLLAAQTTQKALVTQSCVTAMTGGFVSSALGSSHTYPSTLTDQHNLSGSVVASLLPNLPSGWTTSFWCMDSTGAWAFTPHMAAQIQQVGMDGKAWITAQQEKLASLNAQIEVATTVSEVTAIIW